MGCRARGEGAFLCSIVILYALSVAAAMGQHVQQPVQNTKMLSCLLPRAVWLLTGVCGFYLNDITRFGSTDVYGTCNR